MENKTALRTEIKSLRKNLDITGISKILVEKIKMHQAFKSADNVMIYYPLKYEINLLELLKEDKNFYFPKVDGENLLVCPYNDNFQKSELNILEPCSEPVSAEILDLIIVPALAIDKSNYRLGYGGGFYDKFLSKNPGIKTLVPICSKFVYEKLPHEDFDVPVDYVVTD